MASGPGERLLRAISNSYATPLRVSALSMGDPCVLSGIPGALCGVEFVELPLFRDAVAPLVAGAAPDAPGAKYSRSVFHSKPRPNLQKRQVRGYASDQSFSAPVKLR